MNLTQLIFFDEVARISHFTKAAENLNVSQPSLSRAIKSLEKELKISLFEKKGRNVTLSRFGEVVFKHTENILNEIKSIPEEINDIKDISSNTVSILVNSASSQIFKLLIDYQKSYSDVNLKITQLDKKEYENKRNNFDLIIFSDKGPATLQNQKTLLEEKLMLAVPKNHKFSSKEKINLKDLYKEKFISLSENKDLREINDYYCKLAGFIPKIIFENNSPTVIKDYIKTGLGFSIIPSLSWGKISSNDKVKIVKISSPICKRYIILEWNKSGYVSNATNHLKDYIINKFDRY